MKILFNKKTIISLIFLLLLFPLFSGIVYYFSLVFDYQYSSNQVSNFFTVVFPIAEKILSTLVPFVLIACIYYCSMRFRQCLIVCSILSVFAITIPYLSVSIFYKTQFGCSLFDIANSSNVVQVLQINLVIDAAIIAFTIIIANFYRAVTIGKRKTNWLSGIKYCIIPLGLSLIGKEIYNLIQFIHELKHEYYDTISSSELLTVILYFLDAFLKIAAGYIIIVLLLKMFTRFEHKDITHDTEKKNGKKRVQ